MDWQQAIVFLIVAAAAAYLWRQYAASRSRSGCGGCGGCGSARAAAPEGYPAPRSEPELVQLELTPRKAAGPTPPKRAE